MALQELWFGPDAVGSGNGSNYANRARLINTNGTWSSLIKNFDFASGNSLVCYVDGSSGSYTTITEVFNSELWGDNDTTNTNTRPFNGNELTFIGTNGSQIWKNPDTTWICSKPMWDTSNMPQLNGGDLYFIRANAVSANGWRYCTVLFYGIRLTATPASAIVEGGTYESCIIENTRTSSSTNIRVMFNPRGVTNSIVRVNPTGTASYGYCISSSLSNYSFINVRIEGRANAGGTGVRRGIQVSGGLQYNFSDLCVFDHPGFGVAHISVSTLAFATLSNCTIDNCGTGFFQTDSAERLNVRNIITNNFITNCTTAINIGGRPGFIVNNRFREYTNLVTGLTQAADHTIIPSGLNFTEAGTNDQDYKDYAGKNFLISTRSPHNGSHMGAGSDSKSGGSFAFSYFG